MTATIVLTLLDADKLAVRQSATCGTLENVARRDLERYYETLDAELRRTRLTEAEALAICDTLSGTWTDAESGQMLWADLEDAVADGIGDSWSVDLPALAARLQALGPAAQVAICDAVERWRIRSDEEDFRAALRTVGLVRE
jgi:hypothetical protein